MPTDRRPNSPRCKDRNTLTFVQSVVVISGRTGFHPGRPGRCLVTFGRMLGAKILLDPRLRRSLAEAHKKDGRGTDSVEINAPPPYRVFCANPLHPAVLKWGEVCHHDCCPAATPLTWSLQPIQLALQIGASLSQDQDLHLRPPFHPPDEVIIEV